MKKHFSELPISVGVSINKKPKACAKKAATVVIIGAAVSGLVILAKKNDAVGACVSGVYHKIGNVLTCKKTYPTKKAARKAEKEQKKAARKAKKAKK